MPADWPGGAVCRGAARPTPPGTPYDRYRQWSDIGAALGTGVSSSSPHRHVISARWNPVTSWIIGPTGVRWTVGGSSLRRNARGRPDGDSSTQAGPAIGHRWQVWGTGRARPAGRRGRAVRRPAAAATAPRG